jgi:hypothetical protein
MGEREHRRRRDEGMSRLPRRRRRWANRLQIPNGRTQDDCPAAGGPPAPNRETEAVSAEGIQRAIGVLSAGLDSTELQVWAMDELIPRDSDGLSDFLAALYVMDRVLLGELCEATGEPREEILQRLALRVENGRGKPLPGW